MISIGMNTSTFAAAGGTDDGKPKTSATMTSSPATGEGGNASREHRNLAGPWTFRKVTPAGAPAEAWLPATVPGCVHTDLFANGKIGDPFYRLNEKDQQWIDRESWEYRTTIVVSREDLAREHVELAFAGLDTYAEVFVNGAPVLWATNMFRSWRADAKAHLVAGNNTLTVRFRSPILQVKPAYDALGYKLPAANDQAEEMLSMFSRKAPYHYGWDWGPRFVTSGIWKPVALEIWDEARIDDVQLHQNHLDAAVADLTVKARVIATRAGRAKVTVGIEGAPPLGSVDVKRWKSGRTRWHFRFASFGPSCGGRTAWGRSGFTTLKRVS